MSSPPAQNHSITFTLHSAGTTTKAFVAHSLSAAAKKSEDDDFGGPNDSGDVKERRFANCHYLILYQSRW